jgi:hypothetical protein
MHKNHNCLYVRELVRHKTSIGRKHHVIIVMSITRMQCESHELHARDALQKHFNHDIIPRWDLCHIRSLYIFLHTFIHSCFYRTRSGY